MHKPQTQDLGVRSTECIGATCKVVASEMGHTWALYLKRSMHG